MRFILVLGAALAAMARAGKYTVTEEAWFEVEVKDMDGPGEDYVGRFTIALFGETAPMTTMNFAAITKGYKKGGVRIMHSNIFSLNLCFTFKILSNRRIITN